jgi:hypothetical protein
MEPDTTCFDSHLFFGDIEKVFIHDLLFGGLWTLLINFMGEFMV